MNPVSLITLHCRQSVHYEVLRQQFGTLFKGPCLGLVVIFLLAMIFQGYAKYGIQFWQSYSLVLHVCVLFDIAVPEKFQKALSFSTYLFSVQAQRIVHTATNCCKTSERSLQRLRGSEIVHLPVRVSIFTRVMSFFCFLLFGALSPFWLCFILHFEVVLVSYGFERQEQR